MTTIELEVIAVRPEAREMVTIVLQRCDGLPLEYKAGQFLTLLFGFGGRELRRSYSFSSAPGVDALPAITVKRVVNGEVSRYLLGRLQVGDVLRSLPPAGKFLLEPGYAGRLVFLAAGSGMVPILSLLKSVVGKGSAGAGIGHNGLGTVGEPMLLITQNRNTENIPFRAELEAMVREGALQWRSLLSGEAPVARLNNGLLQEMLEDLAGGSEPRFYLCGPAGFMRMAIFTLRLMDVPAVQIRRENFTVEYVPPPPLLLDKAPRQVLVHAGSAEFRFETAWPSTILQSALDKGIALPYSCKGGVCSSCVARCVSGKVKMSANEVLTTKDLEAGLVLTCVGYAETDVELQFE